MTTAQIKKMKLLAQRCDTLANEIDDFMMEIDEADVVGELENAFDYVADAAGELNDAANGEL